MPDARKKTARKSANKTASGPKLLSGGNPQIAKADGDAPVQAYIAAMPGWKGDVGRHLDALIVRTVPKVRKAVRWNTPFYGIEPEPAWRVVPDGYLGGVTVEMELTPLVGLPASPAAARVGTWQAYATEFGAWQWAQRPIYGAIATRVGW